MLSCYGFDGQSDGEKDWVTRDHFVDFGIETRTQKGLSAAGLMASYVFHKR